MIAFNFIKLYSVVIVGLTEVCFFVALVIKLSRDGLHDVFFYHFLVWDLPLVHNRKVDRFKVLVNGLQFNFCFQLLAYQRVFAFYV
jgi:hypothetical protein